MKYSSLLVLFFMTSLGGCKSIDGQVPGSDLANDESVVGAESGVAGDKPSAESQKTFCKWDFGSFFYSNFLGAADALRTGNASPITFTFTAPYRSISSHLSDFVWKPACGRIKNEQQAARFIEANANACRTRADSYDSSYLFKDVWFESRRVSRQKQLAREIMAICDLTTSQFKALLGEKKLAF